MAPDSDLAELWRGIWDGLCRAQHDRHAGFRQPTLATLDGADAEMRVRARMVVLRRADREARTLTLHSDRRAAKVGQIGRCPPVALLFWDGRRRQQLRCEGRAIVLTGTPEVDAAWAALSDRGRAVYGGRPPGEPQPSPRQAPEVAPAGPLAKGATCAVEMTPAGRTNFSLIEVEPTRFDWLGLNRDRPRRALFCLPPQPGPWQGVWLTP